MMHDARVPTIHGPWAWGGGAETIHTYNSTREEVARKRKAWTGAMYPRGFSVGVAAAHRCRYMAVSSP